MSKNGVLNKKFETYYEDIDIKSYRNLLSEAFIYYDGNQFKRVLDMGCGIGLFLESIQPFGFQSNGLEASRYGVNRCIEKGLNCQDFFFEKGKKLPFEKNTFSMVLLNQVIEHLSKETGQYYIGEIIRVLEPGGVAIIKSPSKYSKIWRTDPHHIYCWKPNELLDEINKYGCILSDIKQQRIPVEPWMLFKYDEHIIDTWHKHNKHPLAKKIFSIHGKALDVLLHRIFNSDRVCAVANVSFVKQRQL